MADGSAKQPQTRFAVYQQVWLERVRVRRLAGMLQNLQRVFLSQTKARDAANCEGSECGRLSRRRKASWLPKYFEDRRHFCERRHVRPGYAFTGRGAGEALSRRSNCFVAALPGGLSPVSFSGRWSRRHSEADRWAALFCEPNRAETKHSDLQLQQTRAHGNRFA